MGHLRPKKNPEFHVLNSSLLEIIQASSHPSESLRSPGHTATQRKRQAQHTVGTTTHTGECLNPGGQERLLIEAYEVPIFIILILYLKD